MSSLSVCKLHCDSQYKLDAANTNNFYGEKLKQTVCGPRPCDKLGLVRDDGYSSV